MPVLTSYEGIQLRHALGYLVITPGAFPDGPPAYFQCPLLPVKSFDHKPCSGAVGAVPPRLFDVYHIISKRRADPAAVNFQFIQHLPLFFRALRCPAQVFDLDQIGVEIET